MEVVFGVMKTLLVLDELYWWTLKAITATLIDPYYNNQQGWLWQKNEPKRHPTLSDGQTLRSLPLTPMKK